MGMLFLSQRSSFFSGVDLEQISQLVYYLSAPGRWVPSVGADDNNDTDRVLIM